MALRTRTIQSFQDFARFLAEENLEDIVLFRGQNSNSSLRPKIARILTDRPILEAEQEIVRTFREQSIAFLTRAPNSTWEWLALAQHYGLPTRLLDWTTNPLAALWFAVAKPAQSKTGVVWTYKPSKNNFISHNSDPFRCKTIKVFRPAHVSERIRVQSGFFTVHDFSNRSFRTMDKDERYLPKLAKLIIPSERYAILRYELDQFGVNQSSLFPDLDGLCKHIEWLHSYLSDEAGLRRDTGRQAWRLPSTR